MWSPPYVGGNVGAVGVVVGAGIKGAAILGADLLRDQNPYGLPRVLHDALVGINQGLDEFMVDTTSGVMDESISLEVEFLEDLVIIMQGLSGQVGSFSPSHPTVSPPQTTP